MNRENSIIALVIFSLFVFGCKKNDEGERGTTRIEVMYLDVNAGYAPAANNHYYKITGSEIFEDTGRAIFSDAANYNYLLPAKNNAVAAGLLNIPNKLIRNNGQDYNNEKLADCGGYKIKASVNGKEYNWTLSECYEDNKTVKGYVEKLNAAIAEFQK